MHGFFLDNNKWQAATGSTNYASERYNLKMYIIFVIIINFYLLHYYIF